MNVYSGFIHNHSKLETTPISLNWGMDKQTTVQWNLATEKNNLWIHATWMTLECTVLSKRRQSPKGYILFDSIYVTVWNRQNCRDRKHISWDEGSV